MAIFKCKICGGALQISESTTVMTCDYCGTAQTLPHLDDERRANLYDRANHFRRNNDYDKALEIYEKILEEDKTDAEAYWCIVLCRYGVEYIEDPTTRRRVPTVNRMQPVSVLADNDYKMALKYGDGNQRQIYEKEAQTIASIQHNILQISNSEQPFDVFICYKETDANGRRTPDSVLAADLYHQLTQEGFRVFFSRITLEEKLGSDYEPYIFAALNSAKVMVVLGTKPDYFDSVWVKNEWNRYLALIKAGAKKVLIPAYRDMDPYALPEAFSHLQAQDMSKLGFMQDLIRGIKKLCIGDAGISSAVKGSAESLAIDLERLLSNGQTYLSLQEYSAAQNTYTKVTQTFPEDYRGWWGLIVSSTSNLTDIQCFNDTQKQYKNIMRLANEQQIAQIKQEYLAYVQRVSLSAGDLIISEKREGVSSLSKELNKNDLSLQKEKENLFNYDEAALNRQITNMRMERRVNANRATFNSKKGNGKQIVGILIGVCFLAPLPFAFQGDVAAIFSAITGAIITLIAVSSLSKKKKLAEQEIENERNALLSQTQSTKEYYAGQYAQIEGKIAAINSKSNQLNMQIKQIQDQINQGREFFAKEWYEENNPYAAPRKPKATSSQDIAAPQSHAKLNHCPFCGATLTDSSNSFCVECGGKIR